VDVSVDMSLGEGKKLKIEKRDDGIIHNHRCERNKPYNMGCFQIQQALLFQSYAGILKQSSISHKIGTF
jgi:hypothetical protein